MIRRILCLLLILCCTVVAAGAETHDREYYFGKYGEFEGIEEYTNEAINFHFWVLDYIQRDVGIDDRCMSVLGRIPEDIGELFTQYTFIPVMGVSSPSNLLHWDIAMVKLSEDDMDYFTANLHDMVLYWIEDLKEKGFNDTVTLTEIHEQSVSIGDVPLYGYHVSLLTNSGRSIYIQYAYYICNGFLVRMNAETDDMDTCSDNFNGNMRWLDPSVEIISQ